ncbi:TRAP transporter small permease subunit [Mesorhizobium sp. CAU 1732]|uniref:TRAP transporter small permease subunit n=1 Tax=Mesorhizobium sp. CAU 1732 TaxID=3140358 RepID=UPI003260CF72
MSHLTNIDRLLDRMIARLERFTTWLVVLGGLMLVVSCLLVTVDVFLRKFFVVTLGGANDLAGYAFAIAMSWAMAYVLLNRGHIRVDVLYGWFSPPVRSILDTASALALTMAAMLLLRWSADTAYQSWRMGSVSNSDLAVPLWVPQALWSLGFAYFAAVGLLVTLSCVSGLAQGRHGAVASRFGTLSQLEEAEAEIRPGLPVEAPFVARAE